MEARSESREDYIESILVLKNKNGCVRSIDIADHFNYSRPSISRAMSILKADGMITMDRNGYIELTEEGMKLANEVYSRHKILISFLKTIGVSDENAEPDACRIEHVLSQESIDRIEEFTLKHSRCNMSDKCYCHDPECEGKSEKND